MRFSILQRTAAVLVVVLVVAVGAIVLSRSEGSRDGSTPVGDAIDVPIVRTVQVYRIVADVRVGSTPEYRRTLFVRRPLHARTQEQPSEGEEAVSATILALGAAATIPSGGDPVLVTSEPAPLPVDLRPYLLAGDPLTPEVERREVRRVAGRLCRVVRVPLAYADELASEVNDYCVDHAGIVLEEVGWSADGEIERRVVARSVEEDPQFNPLMFDLPDVEALGREQGAATIRELHPESRLPERDWAFASLPEGFALQAVHAVAPAQGLAELEPERRGSRLRSVVSTYATTTDVLFVERGSTVGGQDPWTPAPGRPRVPAGALGSGEVLADIRGSEVRFDLGGGAFVRVRGSLAPTTLVEIAATLQPVPGGRLMCRGDGGAAVTC